jgi:hypothetical protein
MSYSELRKIKTNHDTCYVIETTNTAILYEYHFPSLYIGIHYRVRVERKPNNIYKTVLTTSDNGGPWKEFENFDSEIIKQLLKDAKEVFSKMKPLKEVTRADLIDLED